MSANQSTINFSALPANQLAELIKSLINETQRRQQQDAASSQTSGTGQGEGGRGCSQGEGASMGGEPIDGRTQQATPNPPIQSLFSQDSNGTNSQTYGTPLMMPPVTTSQGFIINPDGSGDEQVNTAAPIRPRGKRSRAIITPEICKQVILERELGKTNKQVADFLGIAPQTASNIYNNYFKEGQHKKPKNRTYKNSKEKEEGQSILFNWLENEPRLTLTEAWRRLALKGIFVSNKSVYNWITTTTCSLGIVVPKDYNPSPEAPAERSVLNIKNMISAYSPGSTDELCFVVCHRVRGAVRQLVPASTDASKKINHIPIFTFGSIFAAFTPSGMIGYKYSEEDATNFDQSQSMASLLEFIKTSAKNFTLVFSYNCEGYDGFAEQAHLGGIKYRYYPSQHSHFHLGDVIMYNLGHLIGLKKPANIAQLKESLRSGQAFITPGFVKARFMNISSLANNGTIPDSNRMFFPENGEVIRPAFNRVSASEYEKLKAAQRTAGPQPEGSSASTSHSNPIQQPGHVFTPTISNGSPSQSNPVCPPSSEGIRDSFLHIEPEQEDFLGGDTPIGSTHVPANQLIYTPNGFSDMVSGGLLQEPF